MFNSVTMTWIDGIPKDPPQNAELLKLRLTTAFSAINDPNNANAWNKWSGKAAMTLQEHFTLIVDAGDLTTTMVPLAEYIVCAMNGETSVINFPLEDRKMYPVHQKSQLLLTELSKKLKITIYLFSAHAHPLDFMHMSPIGVIGIFDQANSYIHTINCFVVLTTPEDLCPLKPWPWPQSALLLPSTAASSSSTPPPHLAMANIPKHIATFWTEV